MDVSLFYKELDALEQTVIKSFSGILGNILRNKLLNSSSLERTNFLLALERQESIEDSKSTFLEAEKFFLDSRYPNRVDIGGNTIKPSLTYLFYWYKRNAMSIFHNFLQKVVGETEEINDIDFHKRVFNDTNESQLNSEQKQLRQHYLQLQYNFKAPPSDTDDIKRLSEDYWKYAAWQLTISKKELLDGKIFKKFLDKLKFENFQKNCFNHSQDIINDFVINFRKENLLSIREDTNNLVRDDLELLNTDSPFNSRLMELRKNFPLEFPPSNFLFYECLEALNVTVSNINEIDWHKKENRTKIRNLLKCIIGHDYLDDATLTTSGQTYSKKNIEKWLVEKDKDPYTGEFLCLYMLSENNPLKLLQFGLDLKNHKSKTFESNSPSTPSRKVGKAKSR